MRRGRARTTCWRELRGGAKALPRSWDPQFRGSSKSMGTSWFNNFSFRYLSSSIFPVFQLLSPELFAVLNCTVPHRDLSPTRAIGLVFQSPAMVIPPYSPINQDYSSGGRIKSYCILFEDIYYSLESLAHLNWTTSSIYSWKLEIGGTEQPIKDIWFI